MKTDKKRIRNPTTKQWASDSMVNNFSNQIIREAKKLANGLLPPVILLEGKPIDLTLNIFQYNKAAKSWVMVGNGSPFGKRQNQQSKARFKLAIIPIYV